MSKKTKSQQGTRPAPTSGARSGNPAETAPNDLPKVGTVDATQNDEPTADTAKLNQDTQTDDGQDNDASRGTGDKSDLDILSKLNNGEKIDGEEEESDNASHETPPTEEADGELGDLSENDHDANQITTTVENRTKVNEPKDGIVPPPPMADIENPYANGVFYNVDQVLADFATKEDPNDAYQRLLSQGHIENPWAMEAELVRRGYGISPRHDKDGNVLQDIA